MSRVKNPQEKKRLSLDRDRRNVYGENDKASRKSVPRRKQLNHMRIRRAATQELANASGEVDETLAMEAEVLADARAATLRRKSFRKQPDRPLREVIEMQKRSRRRQVSKRSPNT